MVAYSFNTRFVEPILSGRKRQTIRAVRVRPHARPGQTLQLYTGMRTQHCRKIIDATCTEALPIELCFMPWAPSVKIGGVTMIEAEWDTFAQGDGFTDFADMEAFWRKNHPGIRDDRETFVGTIIRWEREGAAGSGPYPPPDA